MLSVKNLIVNYDGLTAVNNFSFTFNKGRICGLIGANGAGKSSLLKACVGLISEYTGEINYAGKELNAERYWVKEHCGYAAEDAVLFPYLTGREFLNLIASIRLSDTRQIDKEIRFFLHLTALDEKEEELIVNFSHGMRQKLAIAAALIGAPDYIIIDESLNGLDPIALFRLKSYLNELAANGKTIILSSHILPLIKDWCDPIVILNNGKLLNSYTKQEIIELEKQNSRNFENIFIKLIDTV